MKSKKSEKLPFQNRNFPLVSGQMIIRFIQFLMSNLPDDAKETLIRSVLYIKIAYDTI